MRLGGQGASGRPEESAGAAESLVNTWDQPRRFLDSLRWTSTRSTPQATIYLGLIRDRKFLLDMCVTSRPDRGTRGARWRPLRAL